VQSGVNAGIFGFLSINMIGVQADFVCDPAGLVPNGVDLSEKQENTPHPARLDRWIRWWAGNASVRCRM